jgi:type I restriction enzyme S subunit
MSLTPYPKYKDSGVEWLGDVPEHWEVSDCRRLFRQDRTPAFPEDDQLSATQKYGVIPQKLFMELQDQKVTLALSGLDNFKHVDEGDFVISLRSFQGGIEQSAHAGCVSPAYTVLKPARSLIGRFWNYLLKSRGHIDALQSMTDGIRDGKSISFGQFGQFPVPQVPPAEQTAIAAFLDRETAKIDALVAEQRRLMELLKEKRQAVISHAVTKGLNLDAPMKDSGIEWLGEVPGHWGQTKLSRLSTRIGDGLHGTPQYVDESEHRFINGNNLAGGKIVFSETTRCVSEEEAEKHRIELNDYTLLLSINGTIGNLAFYHGETVMLGKSAAYINCNGELNREFLFWFLQSSHIARYFDFSVTGTTINNLSLESIRGLPVVLPPLKEQSAIVADLYELAGRFDTLTAEAQHAIALLQERRTALISAAVTGQIDVRGLAGTSV